MYYKLTDVKEELQFLRDKGMQKGHSIGFDWDKLPYSVKLGSSTFIGAPPGTGKTEFQKEILLNLSILHGWNHVIFSPETGSAGEIFAELCYSYIGKPYNKHNYQMSEVERVQAEYFVNEHFYVVGNTQEDIDIKKLYKIVSDIQVKENKKIHTTTVDPWNELDEIFEPSDLGREDKFLSRTLGFVNKDAKKNNRHNFIITHVRDQTPVTDNGVTYFPFPHAREMAGGQTWFRKGMTVMLFWRPPVGLSDVNGMPFLENELHVRIGKVKPKGTSKKGTYKMYLDVKKYQYYFLEGNTKIYADRGNGNYKEQLEVLKLSPSKAFDLEENETPF